MIWYDDIGYCYYDTPFEWQGDFCTLCPTKKYQPLGPKSALFRAVKRRSGAILRPPSVEPHLRSWAQNLWVFWAPWRHGKSVQQTHLEPSCDKAKGAWIPSWMMSTNEKTPVCFSMFVMRGPCEQMTSRNWQLVIENAHAYTHKYI